MRCACRKSAPGLLATAARELGVEAEGSWSVGDGLRDVQAARAFGCPGILLARDVPADLPDGCFVAADLPAAAARILADPGCR